MPIGHQFGVHDQPHTNKPTAAWQPPAYQGDAEWFGVVGPSERITTSGWAQGGQERRVAIGIDVCIGGRPFRQKPRNIRKMVSFELVVSEAADLAGRRPSHRAGQQIS